MQGESSAHPPASWKWPLHLRIWTPQGPKGDAARSVLTVLLLNSDGAGRTWLGLPAIMEKSGLGNERTVRKALDALATGGWLQIDAHTWASLTAEQLAMGRKAPRRGDVGQAPNLYTVLASPSQPSTSDLPTRPNLAPPTESPVDETPRQICRGGQEQICRGGPGANLPPDPDHLGSNSRMESAEGATRAPSTHFFSKAQGSQGDWGWDEAWKVLVRVHAEKTKAVYGLPPMSPDLKRDLRKEVAECLDGAAVDLAAQFRARGMERELAQVRQDLAARVMSLYFRNETAHLRKTKHALRDLPREFFARITEAMQAISRESHDANPPRRAPVLELEQKPVQADTQKAGKQASSTPAEKPMRLEEITALAQKARETLEASTPNEVPRPKFFEPKAARPTPEPKQALPQRPQEHAQDLANASSTVQRSIGRPGAPRWGALAPAPTKVRRVSRLHLSEPEQATESPEPHPRE